MAAFAGISFLAIFIGVFVFIHKTQGPGVHVLGGGVPISLRKDEIVIAMRVRSLEGVSAKVIVGGKERTTATRLGVGAVLGGGVGAAVGAMAKKHQTVLVIMGPHWSKTVVFKDVGKATLAEKLINEHVAALLAVADSQPMLRAAVPPADSIAQPTATSGLV